MRAQRGFSLIELIVATAIAGIVTVGVMQLLRGQIAGYDQQQRVQDAQAFTRMAMDKIIANVTPAGFGIPGDYLLNPATTDDNRSSAGPAPDYLCPGTDVLEVRSRNPLGYAYASAATASTLSLREPNPATAGEAIGPLALHMEIQKGQPLFVFASLGKYALVVSSSPTLVMTSSATAIVALVPNAVENTKLAGFTLNGTSDVTPVKSTRFYVSCEPSSGSKPYLFMDEGLDKNGDGISEAAPIAENIEDLQVAYLLDLDADGTISKAEENAAVHKPTAAQYRSIKAIRVSVVGRSSQELFNEAGGSVTVSQPPDIENHVPGKPGDRYSRRILQQTILLENRDTTDPGKYNHFSSRYL